MHIPASVTLETPLGSQKLSTKSYIIDLAATFGRLIGGVLAFYGTGNSCKIKALAAMAEDKRWRFKKVESV